MHLSPLCRLAVLFTCWLLLTGRAAVLSGRSVQLGHAAWASYTFYICLYIWQHIHVTASYMFYMLRQCETHLRQLSVCICRSWRQALAEDQPFLKHIMVTIDARAPLRGSQLLCECCRGMSVIVQQARHRQTPIPRVIHRVCCNHAFTND